MTAANSSTRITFFQPIYTMAARRNKNGEVNDMLSNITYCAIGFAAGIFVHYALICTTVQNMPPTICDYCQWKKANEWRWQRRKSRHQK